MVLDTIIDDVGFLFYAWRGLVMPRQIDPHPVTGRWTPNTLLQRVGAFLWSLLGAIVIAAFYPILFVGIILRGQFNRLDATVGRLGLVAVGVLVTLAWAAVGVTSLPVQNVVGGIVSAAVGAGLFGIGLLASRFNLRAIAYPAFINTLFLPPVMLSYFVPSIRSLVFPKTKSIVVWLRLNIFEPVGVAETLSAYLSLEGAAYLLFWFSLAIIVGWVLAGLVTLAERIRERSSRKQGSQMDG